MESLATENEIQQQRAGVRGLREGRLARWALDHRALFGILLLGVVVALLHVFLVPPWQHYDEPTHFEYAWLVAHRPTLPKLGDGDEELRRGIAASMLEHGYWKSSGFRPDLNELDPTVLGITELLHPPLYYIFASLPLRLLPYADLVTQLYAARLMSLLLYLITIGAAWRITAELVPRGHPLRWMVPALLVFLPGFADLMTAVNNDVGAVTVFSLFLLGAVRLVKRGFRVLDFVWAIAWTAVGVWTKDTVFIMAPLFLLALFFSLFRGRWRKMVWIVLAVVSATGVLATLDSGDAALWYRDSLQVAPTRVLLPQDPLHGYAFQLDHVSGQILPAVHQVLGGSSQALRGKTVTLGAWMWSSAPLTGRTPFLRIRLTNQIFFKNVEITTTPAFHAITATVPVDAHGLFVDLNPISQAGQPSVTVYYSGIVLAEGERPIDQAPEFLDEHHDRGVWGESPFQNWLNNSSASGTWLRFRPWVDAMALRTSLGQPSIILDSLFDPTVLEWYYAFTAQHIFQTFWVGIGSAHIATPSQLIPVLALLTLAGGSGGLIALWRRRYNCAWELVLLLATAVVGIVGLALVRGLSGSITANVFVANSRYTYPAIIPISLALNLGWLEWARYWRRWHVPKSVGYIVYFSFFLFLNIYALLDMVTFYDGM